MRDGLETLIKSGLKDKLGPMKTHDRAQNHVSLTSKINETHWKPNFSEDLERRLCEL